MRARIGGLLFEGGAGEATYTIGDDGLKGWLEGPGMRRNRTDRPVSHGEFVVPGYLGGRVISLEGQIHASSFTEYEFAHARLSGLLADGGSGRLVVDQSGLSLWADVQLHEAADIEALVWGETAKYQVQFLAADPRRYGETRTFTGTSVYHYGNFPASPVIEVTGTLPSGYTVASQGRSFVVTQALTGGQTHRIDMRSGWLYRNNVLQTGAVSAAGTFQVPAGAAVSVAFTPASGSGVMTVKVPDTYV